MTALGQIFAEIDRRLAVGTLPGIESYERMPSGDPARFPSIEVYDRGDESAHEETCLTGLSLAISVEGHLKGQGGAATHDAMLQLHADVVFALCGDAGQNLGGLVQSIEITGRRRTAINPLAKERGIGFAQDFLITFATPRGNPSIFA